MNFELLVRIVEIVEIANRASSKIIQEASIQKNSVNTHISFLIYFPYYL